MKDISKYNLTEIQLQAYEIGLLWLDMCNDLFANHRQGNSYPKGDPRNSYLWKVCFKLVRETSGLIEDYALYIRAQLDILRAIKIGERQPMLSPMVLVGDKAWIRWKIWKRKLKAITNNSTLEDVGLDKTDEDKVVAELVQTKKYLEGKFGVPYHEPQIMMAKHDMERWVALEKVSPFYALLSPWAQKHCTFKNVFDEDMYKASITPNIKAKFNELFANES